MLTGADAVAQIRELTDGRGADVVIDFVGADATLQLGAAASRTFADLTLVGIAGGTLPLGFFSVPYELSVATTYWGSIPELIEVIALRAAARSPRTCTAARSTTRPAPTTRCGPARCGDAR